MRVTITYVHHNCFVLDYAGRRLVFDYPAPEHLPEAAARVARDLVAGRDLVLVASHGHPDHFDPDILAATAPAASRRFIVSDDVADLFPDSLPADAAVFEPDETREVFGITVETLESNDQGLAYVLTFEGLCVYFGGDLANWNWPAQPEAARLATEAFFHEALKRLAGRPIHVAFSNLDRRLKSLAGGPELARTLKPSLYAPMHAFGDTSWLDEAVAGLRNEGRRVFTYARPGDAVTLDL